MRSYKKLQLCFPFFNNEKQLFFASRSNVSGIFFLSPFTLDLIVASVPFFLLVEFLLL